MINLPLTEKYRPQSYNDLVLPEHHSLHPVRSFLEEPHGSAWLFTGKSGVGKTTLGLIMARAAADHLHRSHLVGPDLDSTRVREIERTILQRPLFGTYHAFLIDESDAIPTGGQIRLLRLLENLQNSVWVFTSNEDVSSFEPRLLSRFKCLSFSTQGLLDPGASWLATIAAKEGVILDMAQARKIIRTNNNNLRASLQELELKHLSVPKNPLKTGLEPLQNNSTHIHSHSVDPLDRISIPEKIEVASSSRY